MHNSYEFLKLYEEALGHVVNFEKSAMLFGTNVRRSDRQQIMVAFNINIVAFS